MKFTADGDAISITARREAQDVVMSVEDTGLGIPAEDLKRVFEIFQTGSAAGDRAGSGLGLGIVGAIVGAIVEAPIDTFSRRLRQNRPRWLSRVH